MMESMLRRLFQIPEMIIILTLMALACLPLALSNIVRDAGVSLLLPLTVSAALIAWVLANRKVRTISSLLVLLGVGPLILLIRISQTGASIYEALKQVILVPINLIQSGSAVDLLPLLNYFPFDPTVKRDARWARLMQRIGLVASASPH